MIRELLQNRAIRAYVGHKAAMALALPVTAGFVLLCLSRVEQGFFFTMIGLFGLQALAELGFNTALAHFSSHEAASLRFDGPRTEGPLLARQRLGSLTAIALAWSIGASLVFTPLLAMAGTWFLSGSADAAAADWQRPWWLLCAALPFTLVAGALRGLAEGCGDVAGSQRSQVWFVLSGNVVTWAGLAAAQGLYAVAAGQLVAAFVGLVAIVPHVGAQLALARAHRGAAGVQWRAEFWPHQWRLGVSWLAGFAMFQSFVPFVFRARGAVEAGQAGILLQAFSLANLLALVWVTAGQPDFGRAWSSGDVGALRDAARTARRRAWLTATAAGAAALMFLALLWALAPALAARVGPLPALAWLMACAVVLQSANVETAIVRFGKKEPFLRNSVAGALAVAATNWLLAPLGLVWLFAGFAFIMAVLVVPWVHAIFSSQLAPGVPGPRVSWESK